MPCEMITLQLGQCGNQSIICYFAMDIFFSCVLKFFDAIIISKQSSKYYDYIKIICMILFLHARKYT